MQKTPESQAALLKEAEFAFKQAFAFCPYSPEAVYRYVNFLLQQNRLDDALIVAQTCLKLDPFNGAIVDLVDKLKSFKKDDPQAQALREQTMNQLRQMTDMAHTNPGNVQNLLALGDAYQQMQNTPRAVELLDAALNQSNVSFPEVAQIANLFSKMGNYQKLEDALRKLIVLQPNEPEARFDLARLEATLAQTNQALADLKISLDLNQARLKTNPKARDILQEARTDQALNSLRSLPAFQTLVPAK
jgi:tetratricopeptide (TPR) repeat protein